MASQRYLFPETLPQSLPVDVERGLPRGGPLPRSYQSTMAGSIQYDELEDSTGNCEREETSISRAAEKKPFYGATPTSTPKADRKRKFKRTKNNSTSVSSLREWLVRTTSYERLHGEEGEEEEPPIIQLIYERSCKDKTKLIILPFLYFLFMVLAAVFAFYSIESLIVSYQHRVRTVDYVSVNQYHPIGIAMFPQDFAVFDKCEFVYNDDLKPHNTNWTDILPAGVEEKCTYINITFYSRLVNSNRTAMVFRGPTHVLLKQSLGLHYTVDTTVRKFSAMEYLLVEYWDELVQRSPEQRAEFLANREVSHPLYTVPAGFRSWVKLYYVLKYDVSSEQNVSDFIVQTDLSSYNDWRNISDRTTNIIYALFEWKTNTYEYVDSIISTTLWNTLGAMAGVFLSLVKAGQFCTMWIQRIKRERRKKLLKLQELQLAQQAALEEFEKRRQEKEFKKQNSTKKMDVTLK